MSEIVETIDKSQQKKSRIIFLILVGMFGIPYLASFYFYFDEEAASDLVTSNKGQLVSPMRAVGVIEFKMPDGSVKTSADYAGQWLMLTIAQSSCEQGCIDNLYVLKQVRRALGVDRRRVERLLVLNDDKHLDALQKRLADFSGMDILLADGEAQAQLASVLKMEQQALQDAFFIVDPLGNYMMYYPPGTHPKDILEDMERVMKVSQL